MAVYTHDIYRAYIYNQKRDQVMMEIRNQCHFQLGIQALCYTEPTVYVVHVCIKTQGEKHETSQCHPIPQAAMSNYWIKVLISFESDW